MTKTFETGTAKLGLKGGKIVLAMAAGTMGLAGIAGCGGINQSIDRAPVALREPAQQTIIVEASDQAFDKMQAPSLSGRKVYVQVVGVFPESNQALLDYLKETLEAKLAAGGAIIREEQVTATKSSDGSVSEVETPPPDADTRVVLAVRAAGADIKTEEYGLLMGWKKYWIATVDLRMDAYELNGALIGSATGYGQKIRLVSNHFLGIPLKTDYVEDNGGFFPSIGFSNDLPATTE